MTRVCFTLQVDPARLDEYRARHDPVTPEMLAAIAASGRRDYSLFLREDGLLIGVYDVEDEASADASLAASEVAAAWEASMAPFFVGLDGRADQAATSVPEVFHLETQLTRVGAR